LISSNGIKHKSKQINITWADIPIKNPKTIERIVFGPFASYESAKKQADKLKDKGFETTVAYPENWEVWNPFEDDLPEFELKNKIFRKIKNIQIILNLKNLYEDKWKLINKINTSITIPIKISIKNSNFIISDKLENILNQSDFVYEYEIEKMNSEEIIYKIIYNNNPEKLLNTLKLNDININSSSDIWYIE